ncbi:MAG: hypothetical protein EKK46_15700 [Rhodocyclaceae bacterium]|nr:MAG: hypothetical protein EKK46_15700 [Rhodocyclaceae bacterium]
MRNLLPTKWGRILALTLGLLICIVQQAAFQHGLGHALGEIANTHQLQNTAAQSSFTDVRPDSPDEPCLTCVAFCAATAFAMTLGVCFAVAKLYGSPSIWRIASSPCPYIPFSKARAPPPPF